MMSDRSPTDILLALSLIEGFTAAHLRLLLGRAGARSDAPERAAHRGGIVERAAALLRSDGWRGAVARVREACDRNGIRVVDFGSDEYPPLLRAIPDPPLVLYWKGTAAIRRPVAVVGSRAPTAPGRRFARELAADLAIAGCAVVSGMARGIDAAAHEGAARVGGVTVAVLGCGADVLYPPEAGALRDTIVERGALASEFPPGTLPAPRNFPRRNRIISGMSRAVVVAEAPARSGALITARFGLEQGREVMAVPGSPLFPHTAGSNRLLRDGACPVAEAGDVLAALGWERDADPPRIA